MNTIFPAIFAVVIAGISSNLLNDILPIKIRAFLDLIVFIMIFYFSRKLIMKIKSDIKS